MMTMTRASIAVALVWVRLYTWRMPRVAREARIAEIESDLWESARDHSRPGALPIQIAARLLMGVPDDLRWRAEQITPSQGARLTLALGIATAALLGVVWGSLAAGGESPVPPPAPSLWWQPKNPPPPPPPPPPPF
jgi:hypothetical protein